MKVKSTGASKIFTTVSFYPELIFLEQQSFPWLDIIFNIIVCDRLYGACEVNSFMKQI